MVNKHLDSDISYYVIFKMSDIHIDTCEWAITLGIHPSKAHAWPRNRYMEYLKKLFLKYYTPIHFVISIEEHEDGRLHGHVYYYGKTIYWQKFNKDYGLGYVKNRPCYNVPGWITYIKKHGDYHEEGGGLFVPKPIERFVGHSLHEEVYKKMKEQEDCIEEEIIIEDEFPFDEIDESV